MKILVESLKRLYDKKLIGLNKLNDLIDSEKISKKELEYVIKA